MVDVLLHDVWPGHDLYVMFTSALVCEPDLDQAMSDRFSGPEKCPLHNVLFRICDAARRREFAKVMGNPSIGYRVLQLGGRGPEGEVRCQFGNLGSGQHMSRSCYGDVVTWKMSM